MKVLLEIDLDSSWDEYKNTNNELLLEDLISCISNFNPVYNGITDIKIKEKE